MSKQETCPPNSRPITHCHPNPDPSDTSLQSEQDSPILPTPRRQRNHRFNRPDRPEDPRTTLRWTDRPRQIDWFLLDRRGVSEALPYVYYLWISYSVGPEEKRNINNLFPGPRWWRYFSFLFFFSDLFLFTIFLFFFFFSPIFFSSF